MELGTWMVFVTVAVFSVASPGPAILLAVSNGVSAGIPAVLLGAFGNVSGLFVLSSISMLGLGAILQTSTVVFTLVKIIGAAYLVYLGVKKFRTRGAYLTDTAAESSESIKKQHFSKYKEGFLIAITNPKAVLFFVALFPLFLDVNAPVLPQFLMMTLTFMGLSFCTLVTFGYMGKRARNWFQNARVADVFHKVTGGVFIGMGVALLQLKSSAG